MSDLSTAPTQAPAPVARDNRVNGVIDVQRPTRLGGWAIDRADETASVLVTLYREGRKLGEVRADQHRPDLERGGIGTGRYGFAMEVDPPIEPGFEFTITAVARTSDGTEGELRPVGRARPAEDVAHRLQQRTFVEVAALGARLSDLASRVDRAADPRIDDALIGVEEALDRIEIAQARLERRLAEVEPPVAPRAGRGLVAAVALALLLGASSLALGVWSMLAG